MPLRFWCSQDITLCCVVGFPPSTLSLSLSLSADRVVSAYFSASRALDASFSGQEGETLDPLYWFGWTDKGLVNVRALPVQSTTRDGSSRKRLPEVYRLVDKMLLQEREEESKQRRRRNPRKPNMGLQDFEGQDLPSLKSKWLCPWGVDLPLER